MRQYFKRVLIQSARIIEGTAGPVIYYKENNRWYNKYPNESIFYPIDAPEPVVGEDELIPITEEEAFIELL